MYGVDDGSGVHGRRLDEAVRDGAEGGRGSSAKWERGMERGQV